MLKKFQWTPYLFLLPAIALLGITTFFPVLQAFYLSFTNYDFISSPNFIGWKNYTDLWGDRVFWKVLYNTLIYLVVATPCLVVMPLIIAILVNQKLKGIQTFRVIYYFPVIVSVVIAGIAWKWIYAENGLLNYFVSLVAFQPVKIPWLTEPSIAIFAIAAVVIWRGLGYYMVIYLAGLQAIPQDLYEAAAIDGSDGWRRHVDITIPLMRPYILLVAVISAISAMKIFEEIYVMARGDHTNSTKTLVYYLYDKGIGSLEMGYASAIGVVLFVVVFVISIATVKLTNPTASSDAGAKRWQ